MLARSLGPALALAFVASLPVPASAQANGAQANGTGIREVSATGRSLITLQTRVRYTHDGAPPGRRGDPGRHLWRRDPGSSRRRIPRRT